MTSESMGVPDLEFRLLGRVSVLVRGEELNLGKAGTGKVLCVLAVLLRSPGTVVSNETLAERVWGDEQRGADVRYKYSSWLRAALEPHGVRIIQRDGGYLIGVEPESIDLHRFRRCIREAREHAKDGRFAEAGQSFEDGLALWRGDALAGVPGAWAADFRAQLGREWIDAVLDHMQLELSQGATDRVIQTLTELLSEHPTDERATALLMAAHHRNGATGTALALYGSTRGRIRASLGVEPSLGLRRLKEQLEADIAPGAGNRPPPGFEVNAPDEGIFAPLESGARPDVDSSWTTPPRQLPSSNRFFAGRHPELERLSRILEENQPPGAPALCVVTGTAGIGKTALAVHWAHQVARRFPDGQLFINLNGFSSHGGPLDPQEVIANFLDVLAVPRNRIPRDLQARSALYRSLLADRTMLIILDNARDAEQVRPLLPGSSSCLVVVTSRSRLASLAGREGALLITLDPLATPDATELLQQRCPPAPDATTVAAIEKLVTYCAGLPLALSLVAARLAVSPGGQPSGVLAQLERARSWLDLAADDEPAADLRAVFSWSYQHLDAEAARLFRVVGLHTSPEISFTSLVAMAGQGEAAVTSAISRLLAANLLEEKSPGRYRSHDLLRAYAIELANSEDGTDERRVWLRRVFDHYLQSAYRASGLVDPLRDQISIPVPEQAVTGDQLATRQEAMLWFAAEHSSLVAATARSAEEGFEGHSWRLAGSFSVYLGIRGHWESRIMVQLVALKAAQRIEDREGEAHARRQIGLGNDRLGHYQEAQRYLTDALELFTSMSNVIGRARTCNDLAAVHDRLGHPEKALEMDLEALRLFRTARHLAGEATTLNSVGWDYAQLGNDSEAIAYCTDALAIMAELDDRSGEAATWDSIGFAQRHLGQPADAVASFERALNLALVLGERPLEAEVMFHLAQAQIDAGQLSDALDNLRKSLVIMNELHDPYAPAVAAALAETESRFRK
jgi:DNA-binding SARP family transcriptional activator